VEQLQLSPPIVFLGPSLPVEDARRVLPGALYLPPVKRSSLKPFLDDPPSAIGIVDGEFYQSLAVSTQEILPFLERGIPVFGSSSMGALRAVELELYGMIGVGRVFEEFRSKRLNADDEVAMTFCPETLRPISEPMVNLRVAVAAAGREGLLSAIERSVLLRRMKALYFPERNLRRLFMEASRIVPEERMQSLRTWWLESAPNAKGEDAAELLGRIAQLGR
jgi:TfuA protein